MFADVFRLLQLEEKRQESQQPHKTDLCPGDLLQPLLDAPQGPNHQQYNNRLIKYPLLGYQNLKLSDHRPTPTQLPLVTITGVSDKVVVHQFATSCLLELIKTFRNKTLSTCNFSYSIVVWKFKAMYDFDARTTDELSFQKGDILFVINKDDLKGWRRAINSKGGNGVIPSNYVVEIFDDNGNFSR